GPLSLVITVPLTAILLTLVLIFGILVVTSTPIRRIPERLQTLFSALLERDTGPDSGIGILGADEKNKPRKRRKKTARSETVAGDNERPNASPAPDEPSAPALTTAEERTGVTAEAASPRKKPGKKADTPDPTP